MKPRGKNENLSDDGAVASKWLETAIQGFIKERGFDVTDQSVKLRAYCCFMVECMCRMVFGGVNGDLLREVTSNSIERAEAVAATRAQVTSRGGSA